MHSGQSALEILRVLGERNAYKIITTTVISANMKLYKNNHGKDMQIQPKKEGSEGLIREMTLT